MDGGSEGSLTVDSYARRSTSEDIRSRCLRELITFNVLPDDVLLEIFGFCVIGDFRLRDKRRILVGGWQVLAHVCRRWRSVVFQSPRHLNLRLLCTSKTPARDTLDIWPPLLLIVRDTKKVFMDEPSSVDNIIAALERNDRVCQIQLSYSTSSQLEYVTDSPALQKPFPELTHLYLSIDDRRLEPILPDSFLGGTAPRLRSLYLYDITFPALPKLLLTATHLVYLNLYDIPRSGYIPPEVMATSLSALTNLESLHLQFRQPRPHPALESRRPPPPPLTRSILPSLTRIWFSGVSEYLEEILARIDAPRLNKMEITFFNQIVFGTPQLFQFISRSPTLRAPEKSYVEFNSADIIVGFLPQTSSHDDVLIVTTPCTASGWHLSFLKQFRTSSLPPVSTLEDLYINYDPHWGEDDVENTQWLELLHPFATVKNLYLHEGIVPRIVPALQDLVGGRTTEVLPTLENIFLEGFQLSGRLHEGIEKFVAARRLTSYPVAVSRWDRW
ncbi:hypothetical protein F5888DRAFT_1904326 [Russula emetica]|nr:hypothetical protein F5888DRAFT_1904326 [Russula emetica]